MKTGLGLYRRYRLIYAYINFFRFSMRKRFLGFDIANIFIQHLDKTSLQLILKKNGAIIGSNCNIETGIVFHNCTDYSNLIIGNNCHIGKNCFLDLRGKIIIKDNVVISMLVTIITHQDISKSNLQSLYPAEVDDVIIEDNCYVGVNTVILKGVVIGYSSVIAAGSLVLSNVESKLLVAGIPAKKIKQLFI